MASRRALGREGRAAGTIDRGWVAVECRLIWGDGGSLREREVWSEWASFIARKSEADQQVMHSVSGQMRMRTTKQARSWARDCSCRLVYIVVIPRETAAVRQSRQLSSTLVVRDKEALNERLQRTALFALVDASAPCHAEPPSDFQERSK